MSNIGVISMGIKCPIIRKGDDLQRVILDSIHRTTDLQEGDVIGITESIVARSQGNYVTVDEIAKETDRLFGQNAEITLINPIYSRNRFSMILKGIARSAKRINIVMPDYDEVGNPRWTNPWTGVNIQKYYTEICKSENCSCLILDKLKFNYDINCLYCGLRPFELSNISNGYTLMDYFPNKCKWGLLGSNKADEETLKLFPDSNLAKDLVESIKAEIYEKLHISVHVMVYGDGCFKDPIAKIWEFADPVTSPAYTEDLDKCPNEIKLKAFADDKFKDLSGSELENAVKSEIKTKELNLKGERASQGTTPRRYVDLLASLMDLTSGSGDKGTPVVLVRNYFKNYAQD